MPIVDSVGIVYRPCRSNALEVIRLVLPLMVALARVLFSSRVELGHSGALLMAFCQPRTGFSRGKGEHSAGTAARDFA